MLSHFACWLFAHDVLKRWLSHKKDEDEDEDEGQDSGEGGHEAYTWNKALTTQTDALGTAEMLKTAMTTITVWPSTTTPGQLKPTAVLQKPEEHRHSHRHRHSNPSPLLQLSGIGETSAAPCQDLENHLPVVEWSQTQQLLISSSFF